MVRWREKKISLFNYSGTPLLKLPHPKTRQLFVQNALTQYFVCWQVIKQQQQTSIVQV